MRVCKREDTSVCQTSQVPSVAKRCEDARLAAVIELYPAEVCVAGGFDDRRAVGKHGDSPCPLAQEHETNQTGQNVPEEDAPQMCTSGKAQCFAISRWQKIEVSRFCHLLPNPEAARFMRPIFIG